MCISCMYMYVCYVCMLCMYVSTHGKHPDVRFLPQVARSSSATARDFQFLLQVSGSSSASARSHCASQLPTLPTLMQVELSSPK